MKQYYLVKRISLENPDAEPNYQINYVGHPVTDFADMKTIATQASQRNNFSPTELGTISSFDWGPTKEGIEGKFIDAPVSAEEMADFLRNYLESKKK